MTMMLDKYKSVMGQYPSGVTILTAYDKANNVPVGLTANSFVSVSLNPLLILFCIDESASSLAVFEKVNTFGVNILGEDQEEQCFRFASKIEDKFSGQDWELSKLSVPILTKSAAILECEKEEEILLGDHTVFVDRVKDVHQNDLKPIVYFDREVHVI